jgi:hypothetical protein
MSLKKAVLGESHFGDRVSPCPLSVEEYLWIGIFKSFWGDL